MTGNINQIFKYSNVKDITNELRNNESVEKMKGKYKKYECFIFIPVNKI